MREPEPGGARDAVDRAVGDQAAAGDEHDELPEAGQEALAAVAEADQRASTAPTDATSAIESVPEARRDHHQLGVARPAAAQHERREHVRDRERQQQPAIDRLRVRAEDPVRRRQDRDAERDARRSCRRSRSCAGWPDTARRPHSSSDVHTSAPAGKSVEEVGAEDLRELESAPPSSSSSPLTSSTDWYAAGLPPSSRACSPRPRISAAAAATITRWTPFGSASSSRISSSATPAVNSTAPAAISGPRCAGGRSSSSRSSRRAMRRGTLTNASARSRRRARGPPTPAAGTRPGRARSRRRRAGTSSRAAGT